MSAGDWTELLAQARSAEHGADLARLARAAERLAVRVGPPPGALTARIALLCGAAPDFLAAPLRLALAARGVWAELHVAGYDQVLFELLDPSSATSAFRPDLALVAFPNPEWPEESAAGTSVAGAQRSAELVCERWLDAARALRERTGAEIALDLFAPLPTESFGHLAARTPGSRRSFLRRANVLLGDRAPPFVHLHDLTALVEDAGLERWLDLRFWHHAKQPVSFECLPRYVHSLAALAAGILGRSRKVLVTDLDDTLWGGIAGEVDLEELEIGEGSARGEAHKALQIYLRDLRRRGVLLAVCSKSDRAVAERPFREHPGMVLGLDDFAAFEASWDPKSDGLRRIARALDVGLDALVFLDDNPAERLQVRAALPEVTVVELPGDPSGFAPALDRARCFEAPGLSPEDVARTESYRARARAAESAERAVDYEAYLRELALSAVVQPFRPAALARIAQLVGKTNQFNLTTQRLGRARLEEIASDPQWIARTLSLSDRFGDHGLVSVVAARRAGSALAIELWLMSCRVLRRRVEHLMLDVLAEAAERAGASELLGTYVPSGRNGIVRELYRELGFELVGESDGTTRWRLSLAGRRPLSPPIELAAALPPVERSDATGASSAITSAIRDDHSGQAPRRPR